MSTEVALPWRIALPTASRTTSMRAAVADGSALTRSIIESGSSNEISQTPCHSVVSSSAKPAKSGSAGPVVWSSAYASVMLDQIAVRSAASTIVPDSSRIVAETRAD